VDMKVQHRIYAESWHRALRENEWPRPSRVVIHDGNLRCEFIPAKYYNLQDSYRQSPHTQFLNARTDSEMLKFVKTWGPLDLNFDPPTAGVVTNTLAKCHARRRQLTALIGLIGAIEDAAMERESLQEFLDAEAERSGVDAEDFRRRHPGQHYYQIDDFRLSVQRAFRVQGSLSEWVARASMTEIRSALEYVVEGTSIAPLSFLRVILHGDKSVVRNQWLFVSLEGALKSMVWFDLDRKDPLYCCQECRRFFKSESKHERKFCDDPRCAKRAARRNWRRRDLAKKRLAKQAGKERGK
jgi:hypothetical protein